MSRTRSLVRGISSWVFFALWTFLAQASLAQPADLIVHGGSILTMAEGSEPEAVAVRGERIVQVGTLAKADALRGPATRVIDLGGQALLPGFIDAHGHLTFQAATVVMADLQPPPAGPIEDISALREALLEHAGELDLGPGDWVLGSGYDDSLLAEGRHPEKSDLDDLFPENPVALLHVSAHLAVTNTLALEAFGYSAGTADPDGGVIRRIGDSSEPNGVRPGTRPLQPRTSGTTRGVSRSAASS